MKLEPFYFRDGDVQFTKRINSAVDHIFEFRDRSDNYSIVLF
jgi:hypothetical protein